MGLGRVRESSVCEVLGWLEERGLFSSLPIWSFCEWTRSKIPTSLLNICCLLLWWVFMELKIFINCIQKPSQIICPQCSHEYSITRKRGVQRGQALCLPKSTKDPPIFAGPRHWASAMGVVRKESKGPGKRLPFLPLVMLCKELQLLWSSGREGERIIPWTPTSSLSGSRKTALAPKLRKKERVLGKEEEAEGWNP